MNLNEIYIVLTYFHNIKGPTPYIAIPKQIPQNFERILKDLMNLNLPETFFELEIKKKMKRRFLNKYFEIPSDWARGKREMALVTVIVPYEINTLFIDYLIEDLIQEIQSHPQMFCAFYIEQKNETICREEYEILNRLIENAYKKLKYKLNQLNYIKKIPIPQNPDEIKEITIDRVNKIILKTFITSIDSTIPQGATILYDIGETLGNQINHLFVGNELRKLLSQIGDFWQRNLLGEIDEVRFESDKKFYFNVYECFECSHMPDIGQTVCKFDEGILTNILSTKLSQPVSVKEIECFATGSDHCRFKIILLDSDQITKLKL